MGKKLKLVIIGTMICCLFAPINTLAQSEMQGIESRIVVRKYVERKYNYAVLSEVPKYRTYSYYDHDYKTTLKGTLELVDTMYMGSYYQATYAGWCSGSI